MTKDFLRLKNVLYWKSFDENENESLKISNNIEWAMHTPCCRCNAATWQIHANTQAQKADYAPYYLTVANCQFNALSGEVFSTLHDCSRASASEEQLNQQIKQLPTAGREMP